MDFEVEELSSPVDSQVIIWKLELPSVPKTLAKIEGAMRIYTTQRDFVGLAPLVMVSWMTVYFFNVKPNHYENQHQHYTDSSISNNCQHFDCI